MESSFRVVRRYRGPAWPKSLYRREIMGTGPSIEILMQSPRQSANILPQVPSPSDSNPNRDTRPFGLLDMGLSHTKQRAAYPTSQDKTPVLHATRCVRSVDSLLPEALTSPISGHPSSKLEIDPTRTKQGTSQVLIDDFESLFSKHGLQISSLERDLLS